jgi:ubiquinone/menaquinone biosynthesis C-methylase UbiE
MQKISEPLKVISGGYILDVACGSGGFTNTLAENLADFSEIIGIDCAEKNIVNARKVVDKAGIRFEVMDGRKLEFEDETFDTVSISNSLHHLSDLSGVLGEMMRVLKPNGTMIVHEMYRDGLSETQMTHVLLHDWWGKVDNGRGIFHSPTFTRSAIIETATYAGLDEMQIFDITETEEDPKSPELVNELNEVIDRYEGLTEDPALKQEGETCRACMAKVGFNSAPSVLIIGKK